MFNPAWEWNMERRLILAFPWCQLKCESQTNWLWEAWERERERELLARVSLPFLLVILWRDKPIWMTGLILDHQNGCHSFLWYTSPVSVSSGLIGVHYVCFKPERVHGSLSWGRKNVPVVFGDFPLTCHCQTRSSEAHFLLRDLTLILWSSQSQCCVHLCLSALPLTQWQQTEFNNYSTVSLCCFMCLSSFACLYLLNSSLGDFLNATD